MERIINKIPRLSPGDVKYYQDNFEEQFRLALFAERMIKQGRAIRVEGATIFKGPQTPEEIAMAHIRSHEAEVSYNRGFFADKAAR